MKAREIAMEPEEAEHVVELSVAKVKKRDPPKESRFEVSFDDLLMLQSEREGLGWHENI